MDYKEIWIERYDEEYQRRIEQGESEREADHHASRHAEIAAGEAFAECIDNARQRMKDEGLSVPLCLTDAQVRTLSKMAGVDPAATEEFISKNPSPFGTGERR